MEPSGPILREQLAGQPVVPATFEDAVLVEFAKVAAMISPCLWYQSAFRDLLGYWTVVAMLKGMVTMRPQAKAKGKKIANMATIGLQ